MGHSRLCDPAAPLVSSKITTNTAHRPDLVERLVEVCSNGTATLDKLIKNSQVICDLILQYTKSFLFVFVFERYFSFPTVRLTRFVLLHFSK